MIAAQYAKVEIETVPVEMGKSNKTDEFLALNPWGKIPTLETPDGGIWESNAIARFVARSTENSLFGKSPFEAAQVEQWVDWVRGDLELTASVWLYPIYGFLPLVPEATEKAKEDILKLMNVLNNFLENRNYFVGDDVTLADIVVSCTLTPLYMKVFDNSFRQSFENVNRWYVNVVSQPNFVNVQGEITLCEQMEVAGFVQQKIEVPEVPEGYPSPVEDNSSLNESVSESEVVPSSEESPVAVEIDNNPPASEDVNPEPENISENEESVEKKGW